jgi:SAM-dependent methyltransferase
MPVNFDTLVADAAAEPTAGWDFSWFDGRASEDRPPWGYANLVAEALVDARAALDVQTGGGEVLAAAATGLWHIPFLAATESWLPNVAVAQHNLAPLNASVIAVGDDSLPLRDESFDLVVSRHPVTMPWQEIYRVLVAGGQVLSQQVGAGSNWELIEFMMGPQPVGQARAASRHVGAAKAAGLEVTDLQEASLDVAFYDVGAVVYFLRKVLWTVPNFTVEAFMPRLLAMHEVLQSDGAFIAHSKRFLITARKPS